MNTGRLSQIKKIVYLAEGLGPGGTGLAGQGLALALHGHGAAAAGQAARAPVLQNFPVTRTLLFALFWWLRFSRGVHVESVCVVHEGGLDDGRSSIRIIIVPGFEGQVKLLRYFFTIEKLLTHIFLRSSSSMHRT